MGASAQQHVDGTDLVSAVQRLLRTLDLHHPAQVDAAVNAMLDSVSKPAGMSVTSDAEKSEKGDDNEKSEEEEEEDEEAQAANAARSEAVLKLLSSTFEGSARAPCGDTHMTLAAAAAAPSAGVRKAVSGVMRGVGGWGGARGVMWMAVGLCLCLVKCVGSAGWPSCLCHRRPDIKVQPLLPPCYPICLVMCLVKCIKVYKSV
jgi:hypothetical protein